MKKIFLLVACLVLAVIVGYAHSQPTTLPKTNSDNEEILINKIEDTEHEVKELKESLEDKLLIFPALNNIETRYKENLSSIREEANMLFEIAKQQISEATQQINKAEQRGNFYLNVIIIIGVAFTIISTGGLLWLRKLQKEFTETVELHRFLQQRAQEKQQELHLQHGYLILSPHERKKFTDLEREMFLDFDHMIYFIYHNLPLTKDPDFYKMSLYMLGTFFLWEHRPERSIIRFEEIERLENIHIATSKFSDKFKYHIHAFYNMYGNACMDYARKYKEKTPSEYNECIKRAIRCYNKSISLKNDFSKPHYNLGLIYGYEREDNEKGMNCYKQVIGKEPRTLEDGTDLYLPTYRNWGCCWVRHAKLKEPDKELISILDNIPEKHSYWEEVKNDEILRLILATQNRKAFLQKKGFSI